MSNFNPDWVSPPGQTLKDLVLDSEKSLIEFSKFIKCNVTFLKRLFSGDEVIDRELAGELEKATGAPKSFWLEREKQYRESLIRLKEKEILEQEWLSNIPFSEMAKLGWVNKLSSKKDKVIECLKFFNVISVDHWKMKYESMILNTAFRKSQSFSSKSESVAAWLRQGEILSEKEDINSFDKEKLKQNIQNIRSLCNIESKDIFVFELKRIFALCGISFHILKAPKGCSASGATYWVNNRPIILLSMRYLSDDHFWFTLFHEIGHIILHDNYSLIIESSDIEESVIEREANEFSERTLIPIKYKSEFKNLRSNELRKIIKFSKKIGISKGIVVGQLQNKKIIPNNHLNKLKVRYKWG
ncbi:hypothetical protein MSP8887_00069 [Marinomonas spartinae]|uniref:ImmA/IrrE family metallo-endopeptidase n=1 Tax=Marinomonas spartinae TaxID=1792290 RepID=UPI000808FEC7|nr:ImmA/IrrE family metallo-endopeptidase [Marinomonas spartinae]SBS24896.1 hypothetical protein MSP8887_00069 [Marinomonas spartinae]